MSASPSPALIAAALAIVFGRLSLVQYLPLQEYQHLCLVCKSMRHALGKAWERHMLRNNHHGSLMKQNIGFLTKLKEHGMLTRG